MNETCSECGAKTVKYKHGLNAHLVSALYRLHRAGGGPVSLKALNMSHSMWDNFQKLKYFGLVEKTYIDGKRIAGVWQITPYGTDFITGQAYCYEYAWSYRGDFVEFDGSPIWADEVLPGYMQAQEYAATAQAHTTSKETS